MHSRVVSGFKQFFWVSLAVAVIAITTYILSWRMLASGLFGNDSPYQLHLVQWINQTFPSISWWYPNDASGMSYREGYPLAVHWLVVALSRLSHLGLVESMQVAYFLINPLCALGIYLFCSQRLKRPLAGVIAAFLFLLSPITWDYLVSWGLFANQAGTILLIPALFCIDVVFCAWRDGKSTGARFRLGVVAFIILACLMGYISPSLLGVPLVLVPLYAFAIGRAPRKVYLSWLLLWAPFLVIGSALLSAFWSLPMHDYLGLIASRHPSPAYNPQNYPFESWSQILGLQGIRIDHSSLDSVFLTPAVWFPSIFSIFLIFKDRRVRVLAAIVALGLIEVLAQPFYAVAYQLPGVFGELAGYLFTVRAGTVYLSFFVPILAALALEQLPQVIAERVMKLIRAPRVATSGLAIVIAIGSIGLTGIDFGQFTGRVQGHPNALGYGPYPMTDLRDLWGNQTNDTCGTPNSPTDPSISNPLCSYSYLNQTFSLQDILKSCANNGNWRSDVPVCLGIGRATAPRWNDANNYLIDQTLVWCQTRLTDPVCRARYLTGTTQIINPSYWRPLQIGCYIQPACQNQTALIESNSSLFPTVPQRAALSAATPLLLMDLPGLTGGSQFYSYNYQLPPSPELNTFAVDVMIDQIGTSTAKTELSKVLGLDYVVLAKTSVSQINTYLQMGWTKVASDPVVLRNPNPSTLATEWTSGSAVLVMGESQAGPSHPYNDVYRSAIGGLLPTSQAWLVRASSPYIDDYSLSQLERFPVLFLLGYQYHSASTAMQLLSDYVHQGGSLYMETGWQYVDPDWAMTSAPGFFPVSSLSWTGLTGSSAVVDGTTLDMASFNSSSGPWGASVARSAKPGATSVLKVGTSIVAAGMQYGKGKVFWSGMNLFYHADASSPLAEQQYLQQQLNWLLPSSGTQQDLRPQFISNDQVTMSLASSNVPTDILFKESYVPGWSATLVWAGGSISVPIDSSEQDFMLVHLSNIPAGATLQFSFGPPLQIYLWWLISILTSVSLLLWVFVPWVFGRVGLRVVRIGDHLLDRLGNILDG